MDRKSIAFHHFGCKVNFAEASALSRQFSDKGYELRDFRETADVYVISSCVVTAIAEKKCRAAIRQAHRLNPKARIAVIGCFSELKPGELAGMEGVDLVLGHTGKFSLAEELDRMDQQGHDYHGGMMTGSGGHNEPFIPSYSSGDRTRSFLKIQDGCDYFCSYCTIPVARGRSRSDTIAHVESSVREIIARGIREIVLTGVNLGDFGKHNGERFSDLVKALESIDGIDRIRISSIEPDLLTDEIIERVAASRRFLPHFHIPLQSGCDRILKAMHRKYDRTLYASRVTRIRELLPHACIAADVITGFPGETEGELRDTAGFLEALDISYMHVFTYSRRENTLASKMENPVGDLEKKVRSDYLHHLSERKKEQFYRSNHGRIEKVLFESDRSGDSMHGFTTNYIRVRTPYDPSLANTIVDVRLGATDPDGTYFASPPFS